MDTLNRWIRKYKKTGSVEPEKQEKFRRGKFSDEELLDAVNKKPSSRLDEIAKIFLYQERNEKKEKSSSQEQAVNA